MTTRACPNDARSAMRPRARDELVAWIGALGAAGADDVAVRFAVSPRCAGERLRAAARAGLVEEVRLLHGQPALYVATVSGLRSAGLIGLERCRLSPSGFSHARACAGVAAALARAVPDAVLASERELRLAERVAGRALASAEVGLAADGSVALHRPDLVMWPAGDRLPVAIEVELTVKAARRLRTIVRGWARSRLVASVVYYASPPALRAVRAAVAEEWAATAVHVLSLASVGDLPEPVLERIGGVRSTSPVPSGA